MLFLEFAAFSHHSSLLSESYSFIIHFMWYFHFHTGLFSLSLWWSLVTKEALIKFYMLPRFTCLMPQVMSVPQMALNLRFHKQFLNCTSYDTSEPINSFLFHQSCKIFVSSCHGMVPVIAKLLNLCK